MLTLSARQQFVVGSVLMFLLVATRGHHFASIELLPGASWAVFFLAGIYLRPAWVLLGLLSTTWLLDYNSYLATNGTGFCFSPSYVFLLPAYSSLWLAGRWYAKRHKFELNTLALLSIAVLSGAFVCELLSSGGYYYFSGKFEVTTVSEFASRVVKYFPMYLQSIVFYTASVALLHFVAVNMSSLLSQDKAVEK